MEDSPADFTGIQIEAANPESKYPLVNIQKAMENGHLYWVFPLKIVIFMVMLVYQRVMWLKQ